MPKRSKKTTVSSEAIRKKKHQEAVVKTASDLVTALREKAELTVDLRYANAQISDLQSRLNQTLQNLEAQQKIVSALQGNLEVAGAEHGPDALLDLAFSLYLISGVNDGLEGYR